LPGHEVDASVDFVAIRPHRAADAPSAPAAGGRREQTKTRNRETLLVAARRVFAELGYGAATVRDIVRATDLGVGTFYEYFRDKDDVFRAVAHQANEGLRARLRMLRRDRRLPFEERIYRAYLAYFAWVRDERALWEVIDRNLGLLGGTGSEPGRELALAIDELREDLLPDLAPDGLDPGLVATAMVGVGLVVARRELARGALDPEAAARFCTRFSLEPLRGSSRRVP
jgi:AcrR family transcriptional regulator